MPKARPSQVIVHRIELQDTERELLEQYLQNDTIQSYADAGKALAIPLAVGGVCVVAYLIADGIFDFALGQFERLDAIAKQYEEKTGKSGDFVYGISPITRLWAIATGK